MLSLQKLKQDKIKVNQHLTELGIKKENQKDIIEAVALTLQPKEFQSEQKSVDEQIVIMKREQEEKKLLEYQLKTNPQTVSTFLANKYSDGNFNKAVVDLYDNTEERIKKGLTFEYHVYLPEDKRFNDQRGKNRYHLSEPIMDHRIGDKYIYHIPIHIDSSGNVPFFVTDYGEVVNDPNSRGLLWALSQLKAALDTGKFAIDPDAEVELTRFGFLEDGKIIHDIKGGMMVEKYLNTIVPEKKVEAIKYLDTSLKKYFGDGDNDITEPDETEETSDETSGETPDETDEEDAPVTTTTTTATAPSLFETIPITASEYSDMNLEQIAKINKIPVVDYTQIKSRSDATLIKLKVYILSANKLFRISLRTGTRRIKVNSVDDDIYTYYRFVRQDISQGLLTVPPIPARLGELLSDKGFSALLNDEEPPVSVSGFSTAKPL